MGAVRALAAPAMEGRRVGTPGGRRAGDWVAARFAEIGLEPVAPGYRQAFGFEHTSVKALVRRDRPFRMHVDGANLLGQVKGAESALPVIVLSAHYDHVGVRDGTLYPGADDNASGVAVLLEAARFVKRQPLRHTVVFAAFDAEEVGLRGAEAFLAAGPIPRERIGFDLNLDMVGRNAENVLVAAGTHHTPSLVPVVQRLARHAAVRLRMGHDRPAWQAAGEDWTSSSDHGPFHDAGIPFLYYGVEDHPDYHQPGDLPERVQPDFLRGVAELVIETLLAVDGWLATAH
jgi:Zn-dependent M28 family amino/carboxypeptidase